MKGGNQLAVVEAQFGEAANQLYEGLLDLNTPAESLTSNWQQLIAMRNDLLAMYGVPVQQHVGLGGGQGGGWEAPDNVDAPGVDWKGKLLGLIGKRTKRTLQKGELVFQVIDKPGVGFAAVLESQHLAQQYVGEAASKKLAESAAASSAVWAEFPEEAQRAVAGSQGQDMNGWGAQTQKGKKRPLAAGQMTGAPPTQDEPSAKGRLMQTIQLLLGRPVQKGEVCYDTQPVDPSVQNSAYVSTVSAPSYDSQMQYAGEASESKKQAENSAAVQMLEALREVARAAEEEHKAKKAKVRQEKAKQLKANKAGATAAVEDGVVAQEEDMQA